jgi:hypothetical protein
VARGLGDKFVEPLTFAKDFEPRKVFLDRCLSAADNLKTIDPHDKEDNETLLVRAREWIKNAGVIYILGYGFDANNNQRIGLSSAKEGSNKTVMFTNFRDLNTINKKASKRFFEDRAHFSNSSPHGQPKNSYFEKHTQCI